MNPEIFGAIAAFLTTSAYLPQAIKAFRLKETKDLSLVMYIMMTVGIFCWFIYGLMIHSPSLIFANGITLVLTAAILVLKLRHG